MLSAFILCKKRDIFKKFFRMDEKKVNLSFNFPDIFFSSVQRIGNISGSDLTNFVEESIRRLLLLYPERYSRITQGKEKVCIEEVYMESLKESMHTVRIPQKLEQKLLKICGNFGCSISSFVSEAIRKNILSYPRELW